MWRPPRAGCDTSLAPQARGVGRSRRQTHTKFHVCCVVLSVGSARQVLPEWEGGSLLREFAEETLGLYGGADVNAATVKASAETMAGRLRAAVGTAGGGDGGERCTNPLRWSSRTQCTGGGNTYRCVGGVLLVAQAAAEAAASVGWRLPWGAGACTPCSPRPCGSWSR